MYCGTGFNAARSMICGATSHTSPRRMATGGFNAARGFVGGAALSDVADNADVDVSMPHAALWVVQPMSLHPPASAGFVSMPHAALWVVQHNVVHAEAQ